MRGGMVYKFWRGPRMRGGVVYKFWRGPRRWRVVPLSSQSGMENHESHEKARSEGGLRAMR